MSDAKCPLGLSEWQHDEYSHLTRENVRLLTMMRQNAAQRAIAEAELELYKLRTEARMRELQSKISRQRSAIKRLEDMKERGEALTAALPPVFWVGETFQP